MMESAADIEPDAVFQRQPRRQYGPARRQPERLHHLPRIRDLQPQDVLIAQRAAAQFGDPLCVVHQPHVLIGGRLGLDEIFRRGEARAQHAVVQPAVFLRGKDVLAQMQIVAFVVNQPKRQHGPGAAQSVSDCSAVTTATL